MGCDTLSWPAATPQTLCTGGAGLQKVTGKNSSLQLGTEKAVLCDLTQNQIIYAICWRYVQVMHFLVIPLPREHAGSGKAETSATSGGSARLFVTLRAGVSTAGDVFFKAAVE